MGIQDNCGLFAFSGSDESYPYLTTGIFHLQHRGQNFCGISTFDGENICFNQPKSGLVKQHFSKGNHGFEGRAGIGQVSLTEPQPFLVERSQMGQFAVAYSGRVFNQEELEAKYGVISFYSPSTEILARIIRKGKNVVEGIKEIAKQVKGGWAIEVLTQEGEIFVARDPFGFCPLVLGKSVDGCAAASESVALSKVGMDIVRDVKAGEIIKLEENGFHTAGQMPSPRTAYCAFEWAYIARVSSVIEGISVKKVRTNMGMMLAKNDKVEADIVAGIPMSGIGHALGYARGRPSIPYEEIYGYNRYADRSYIASAQETRDIIAGEKLSEIKETIDGSRIILVDDSIVRGTQIRKLIFGLNKAGAKEVHLRISCPKLLAPCKYNMSTRTNEELIAVGHTTEEMRKMFGATTLKFNTVDDFVKAIGLPEDQLCLACFTGKYPQ